MTARAEPAAAAAGYAYPVGLLLVTVSCFQLGGSLAKHLFPAVGPLGASALRMGLAALFLLAVTRPWRRAIPPSALPDLVVYGLSLAGLNTFFYLALQHIPIGIAVTIDFLGPLAVAVAASRRPADFAWIALAALGILLFMPVGPLATPLDVTGVLLSLGSAASWALYIVCGRRVGRVMPAGQATALGVTVAALATLPLGVAQGGARLVSVEVLPLALLIAGLSSALPFRLEMIAMQRLPARVFGVLMSLEPAFAALYGWLILQETLTGRQGFAIACVIGASAGVTLTVARAQSQPGLPQ